MLRRKKKQSRNKSVDDLIMIYITVPVVNAERLVQFLLEKKLIACATIFSAMSMYWWQGAIEHDKESIIIAKTMKSVWHRIQQEIMSVHPYAVPCILAWAVKANKTYNDFVAHAIIR